MSYLSEFQTSGFDEVEIVRFLAKHGINIGDSSIDLRSALEDAFPDWKRVMSLLPSLTDREAASAFADIDMNTAGRLSDDSGAELSRWQTVIQRAIRAGELEADVADFEKDGKPKAWSIAPAKLAAWCATKGLAYPLPGGINLPATDAELRDALTDCERDRAQWKAKADGLELVGDQRQTLRVEIDRLRDELRAKEDEVAALSKQRDALKEDVLSGKTKSTALKIIGGLAIRGYGLNIHAERLERIGEIVRDLESVGAGVTEKTVREFIKEEANIIELGQARTKLPRKPL